MTKACYYVLADFIVLLCTLIPKELEVNAFNRTQFTSHK